MGDGFFSFKLLVQFRFGELLTKRINELEEAQKRQRSYDNNMLDKWMVEVQLRS